MEVPANEEVQHPVHGEHGEYPGEAELGDDALGEVVPANSDLELLREHDVLVPKAVGRDRGQGLKQRKVVYVCVCVLCRYLWVYV